MAHCLVLDQLQGNQSQAPGRRWTGGDETSGQLAEGRGDAMSYAPRNVIVIGVDWGPKERPKPDRRHHRARRADWPLRQPIPQREPIERQLADQLLRQGKRVLAEAHGHG
jgi:hypothetical protein